MSASRAIRGVAGNFLGTYLSRCSDYQGYWLLGFLVADLRTLQLDLLSQAADERPVFQHAFDLAASRFRERLCKGGVALEEGRAAELRLSRELGEVPVEVNGSTARGWRAAVSVESRRGRRFAAQRRIVVAPHDAAVESRSTRA